MRRAAFVAAAVVLVVSGTARAETRSLRIDYQAAQSCPNEQRFVELARDRVREWPAVEERGDLVARVRAEKHDGVFIGQLALEDASGASLGMRTIQEEDCDDVVLALALFLGVALEADAESHAKRQTSTPVETPEPAPVEKVGTPAPSPIERSAPVDATPTPPRDRHDMTWEVFARAHGMAGRMPDVSPGAALGVELGLRRTPWPLRPFGGLGIDATPVSTRREGRGRVEIGWGAIFGRACVGFDVRPRDRRDGDAWLEPWACVRAEGGNLRAASRGYATNRTENLAWYAVGAETGISLRLTHRLSVGAFASAMAPVVRHELVLHEALLFRAPPVTGEAGLELKVRIW